MLAPAFSVLTYPFLESKINRLPYITYQGKRSVTLNDWKIQFESLKWGVKSKVGELSRTENSVRSFDQRSSRTGSPFDNGDPVRELVVRECVH